MKVAKRWEADRRDDSLVEFGPQCLNDDHPVGMRRQAPARGTADAMPAVELNIKRVEHMTAWTDGDLDAIVEGGALVRTL